MKSLGTAKSKRIIGQMLVLVLAAMSGCALFSTGPEIVHAKNYRFRPDAHWSRVDKGDSDEAYRTPSGEIFSLTSSCNGHADAPLEVLTRHLLMGSRKVSYLQQRRLKVDGSEALFSEVKNVYDDEPFNLLILVVTKSGCIFDFTLLSPKTITDKQQADYWAAIKTFAYGKN